MFTESVPELSVRHLSNMHTVIDTEITYTKPTKNYSITGDMDITHGRHLVDLEGLKDKLMRLLQEATNYLKENQVDKHPEWKSGQIINRILYTMSYMNFESINEVYRVLKHPKTEKDETMKYVNRFFLTSGTPATISLALDSQEHLPHDGTERRNHCCVVLHSKRNSREQRAPSHRYRHAGETPHESEKSLGIAGHRDAGASPQ